jgi:hypothetical protein
MAPPTSAPENDFKRILEAYIENGELQELLQELDPAELEEMREDPDFAALLPPKPRRRPPDDYEYLDKEVRRMRGEEVDDD